MPSHQAQQGSHRRSSQRAGIYERSPDCPIGRHASGNKPAELFSRPCWPHRPTQDFWRFCSQESRALSERFPILWRAEPVCAVSSLLRHAIINGAAFQAMLVCLGKADRLRRHRRSTGVPSNDDELPWSFLRIAIRISSKSRCYIGDCSGRAKIHCLENMVSREIFGIYIYFMTLFRLCRG